MVKNSKIAKKANVFQVLKTIRKGQPITIEEIIDQTGLSRPTVISILKELQITEKVSKSGFASSDVGRQPMLYALNTKSNFAIGIDVDGPPINLVVSDVNGKVVYNKSWTIDLFSEPENISARIINELDTAIAELNIDYKDVFGIAIGLPASIDIKNNCTVRLSRIKQWNNYLIDKDISNHTGKKIYIRNDAHLLSIAEHEIFSQSKDSLYIVLRSGIGMAAIINNQIYEGEMGNAGYIGHTILQIDGRNCDCGLKGCFETYCSKRAIVQDYVRESKRSASYLEILNLAEENDEIAKKVLINAGNYFGVGISNFIKLYEIYTVILGDMGCSEDHIFIKSIINTTKKNLINFSNKEPNILLGKLKSDNFGLGGCYFILSKFFASPKLVFK